jgi:hypothetical protein
MVCTTWPALSMMKCLAVESVVAYPATESRIDRYANGVYHVPMEFIETPTFTRLVTELLTDDEYRQMQNVLVEDPERGDLIKGGGGIRKLRHAVQGRGKSGGVRAIYYWMRDDHQIYMLVVYPKSKKDDLTDKEVAILRELVKEL